MPAVSLVDPLIWQIHLPRCRKNRCQLRLEWDTPDANTRVVHQHNDQKVSFQVTAEDMRNVNLDVWGEKVEPWLKTLHPEASDG